MKKMVRAKRLLLSIAAALLMLLGTAGTYVLMTPDSQTTLVGEQQSADGTPANGTFSTDGLVALLQERLSAGPPYSGLFAQLGAAYLQRARETGDPNYYPKAEAVLRRALELDSKNSDATNAMGALALARHQFREALAWAEQARSLNPYSASSYGVAGDALVELGRYPEAFQAFQEMVDRRPDLSAYSRVSHARELAGDITGAIAAMTAAVNAGGPVGESVAWARVHLGNLYWTYQGDLRRSEEQYRRALLSRPDYAPALSGLAQVAAARGDMEEALKQARRAASLMPSPEHVILLRDLLCTAGFSEEALRQDALVRAIDQLARAAGVDTDLEIALFEADLGERPNAALDAASRGYMARPSIKAADTLAWALFTSGRVEGARTLIQRALSLGSQDPLTHYHAGKIALASGDPEGAAAHLRVALTANPHFSLRYAEDASVTLAGITEAEGGRTWSP